MKDRLFAVLTGDVAGSSRFSGEDRKKLLDGIKTSFIRIEEILGTDVIAFPFEIFRGDSFQGVLGKPELALKAALIIRAGIRGSFKTTLKDAVDARIAIGIGTISLMPQNSAGEGDGEAYRNSGPYLDKLEKAGRMLSIKTPWDDINKELNVECALLDTIVNRWTAGQTDVVSEYLRGLTQEEMAERLNVSQPAARKRIQAANLFQIEIMLRRYEEFFEKL
ncbi:MAG: SatD family protein [Bacteroidales bacterium]